MTTPTDPTIPTVVAEPVPAAERIAPPPPGPVYDAHWGPSARARRREQRAAADAAPIPTARPVTKASTKDPRPDWWPAGEPWPPKTKRTAGETFLRGVGCFFLGIIGLVVIASVGAMVLSGASAMGGWALLSVVLVIGLIVVYRMLQATVAPMRNMMIAVDRIGEGDYSARVDVAAKGDVAKLVAGFNHMAERLEIEERQRKALFADVAHEMRTPLAVVQGTVEGMLDGIYERDDHRLESIIDSTAVMTRLLDDLRTLSLADSGGLTLHKEPTDLSDMVDDLLTAWEPRALEANVRITAAVNVPGTLDLDPVRIRQVLDNLIANAVRHTAAGGDVQIDARLTTTAIQVSVKDTGDGIPAEDLPHIFDRFWKSKDSGGSGLGLAIAKGVVTAHGGTISADSSVGTGTISRISLPREILISGATVPRP